MKNKIDIRGDITAIILKRNDGTLMETIIDTADLSKVHNEFPYHWYPAWDEDVKSFYAHGHYKNGARYPSIPLHRFLLDAPIGMVVDHINHDTLDNRRCNLRIVTVGENNQNHIKASKK